MSISAVAHEAHAQARTDADLQEGAEVRVLSHRHSGAGDAMVSPTMDVEGHVALVPLLRVGAYAHYDVSPISGEGSRQLASGGLDLRVTLPWLRGSTRAYARFGLGEVGILASAHVLASGGTRTRVEVLAPSSGGNFTEAPLALGFAYRQGRALWLTAEAGARVGFGFGGSAYGASGSGNDVVALFLDTGISWGR